MDSTHPTAGWEKVGDRFYRKIQLYTAVFDLDLDLDNFFVAGAPYGGAVGVFPRLWLHFVLSWTLHGIEALTACLRFKTAREADDM
jgi:hypothetical protein